MPRVYVRKFDYEEARRRYAAGGVTMSELAEEYGVSQARIHQVVTPGGIERTLARSSDWQRSGTCPDCGTPATRTGRIQHRCRECSARKQAITVRDEELRCVTCKQWKPDESYPLNRNESPFRRGRHSQCTACGTERRRDYRRRNAEKERAYWREYNRRRKQAA
jgi:hypothetical protein